MSVGAAEAIPATAGGAGLLQAEGEIAARSPLQLFWRRFRCQTGRRIEARIGLPGSHRVLPFVQLVMPWLQEYQRAGGSR